MKTGPRIIGVLASETPDENEVYQKAVREWRKQERLAQRRQTQVIEFDTSPICLTFAADLHLGSGGVDYPRVFDEAQTIVDTDGMYLILVGDLLDNFIVPKLMSARHAASVTIEEEWTLVRKYLKLVAPKLLASVSGNHESWTWVLGAVDYFKATLEQVQRGAVYDTDDAEIELRIGKVSRLLRLRHQWQGVSIYNDTHGIERAAKFGERFDIGVGAHTHRSGLVREFNNGGQTALAVLCGSYKRIDAFARRKGFPRANNSTAMSVIFFADGTLLGVGSIAHAAELMKLYRNKTHNGMRDKNAKRRK